VGSIPWAWNAGGQGKRMETNVRRVLNMKPEDLFLGGAYIDDKVAQDPKAWVEKMVQQFKERNTEGIES
jgi:hypothetical protein